MVIVLLIYGQNIVCVRVILIDSYPLFLYYLILLNISSGCMYQELFQDASRDV
jgi:hypothetical protein